LKIIFSFLLLYLFLPYIGLFNYNGFGGEVSFEMKVLMFIHIVIEISIISFFVFSLKIRYPKNIFLKYNINKLFKTSIIILIFSILINMFVFGNYQILLRHIGRGEFRTTLHLGFIYTFLSFYLPSAILALNMFIYSDLPKLLRQKLFKKILIIFVLSMFLGFLTGFKSTAIIIALVGLAAGERVIRFKYLVLLSIGFILLMGISGYLFMNFSDFSQVIKYLFVRATSVAVDGTVGVYNLFPNGGSDSYMILLYTLGNKLSSLITGFPTNSIDFLHIDLGRYIGYLTYPSNIAKEALSGAFNLTITNFGESIYLFGKKFFYIYTILISFIIGMIFYLYSKTNLQLKIPLLIFIFTNVVIGGGKITNIFSIPVYIYMLMIYILINFILSISKKGIVYEN